MFLKHKILEVETCGSPILKNISIPVASVTEDIITLADEMIKTMRFFDGVGLAAPQIGLNKRLVAFALPMPRNTSTLQPQEQIFLNKMPLAVINPQIISYSTEKESADEGCLSVPEIYAPVKRPSRISVCCTLLDNSTISFECGGLTARCIQHEIDHLDGKLFVDRLKKNDLKNVQKELDALLAHGKKCNFKRKK